MAETNNTPEEIKVLGVRKSIIEERLNDYRRRVYELADGGRQALLRELELANAMLVRAQGNYEEDPENQAYIDAYEAAGRRVRAAQDAIDNAERTEEEPKSEEYYRMADVIPELEDILRNADPNLEYIPIEEIQRRLGAQRDLKARLEAEQRGGTVGLSEEEIAEIEARIAVLQAELERYALLIENEEQSRQALEQEKAELEARIAEITAALENDGVEQGEGATPLSQEERQELEDRLSAARTALNARNETLGARREELDELKRQRDAEIARNNNEEEREKVVSESETIEDMRNQAENALNAYAEAHGIDPSELAIERSEIEDLDDGPKNTFRIVRVKKVNEPILTTDERAEVERELTEAEARLQELEAARKNPRDNNLGAIIADIDAEISSLTDQIVANNESYATTDRRVEANEPLIQRRTLLQNRRTALNRYRTSMTTDIDAEINNLRSQIVANNESYATTDRRVEANEPLQQRIAELEARKNTMRNMSVTEMLADIDAQIIALRDQIVANNEASRNYSNKETIYEANAELRAQMEALQARKNEILGMTEDLAVDETAEERAALEAKIAELRERLSKDDALKAKNPRLQELEAQISVRENEITELEAEIAELEKEIAEYEKQIEDDDKARTGNNGLNSEERAALEAELKEKQEKLGKVNEALENPENTKAYMTAERERINLLIIELIDKIEKSRQGQGIEGVDNSEQIRIADNKIKELEELEKLKEEFTVTKEPISKGDPIPIPPIEDIPIELDKDRIKDEYLRRKHDMYAKYYGDKEYQAEYDERAARFREHEVEAITEDGISYRTVEDYPEKAEDERFLLLENYQEALERMTRDQKGDTSVYRGTPEQIEAQRAKDREYVETRNHTFDQHKYTQKDLATLGKYGEKMPYLPKTDGIAKNVFRGALNVAIFARNVVAPVYRVIGKYVAQPFHRLVTGEKDASPYRNNFYHRMVARREYFADQLRLSDEQETRELQERAAPGEEVKPVRHTLRNWAVSRWNAVFKSKEGNEAVLNAGEHDIQTNIIEQERADATVKALQASRESMARQIQEMEDALAQNPNAPNADEVRKAIEDRKAKIESTQKSIDQVLGARVETKQTDAVSDRTHAIARKEINTFRTTVIKGVAKSIAAKYIGPAIEKWILEHSKIKSQEWVEPTTKQEWVEETSRQEWVEPTTKQEWVEPTVGEKSVPVFEDRLAGNREVEEAIAARAGTEYTGYYSVSGGHRGPRTCTLSGDEKITGWWVDDGSKWGTGVSDSVGHTAPTFTDRLVDAGLMDANGVFRQDVSPNEILRICKMEGIDPSKVYVSVGDNHWAKAADVFGVERVQVGEELVHDIIPGHFETVEVPGYWDTVIEPGHWTDVTVPGFWRETIIDNPRVIHLVQGGKVVARTAMVADTIQDVAENLRNTHTDVREHKPQPREYDGDPNLKGYFGSEEHPTSKIEYEQQRRDRRTRDDDDEQEL